LIEEIEMKLSEPAGTPTLKNILFATDLSSTTENVMPRVLKIAERYGATICALHVIQPDVYPLLPPDAWPEMAREAQSFRQNRRAELEQQLQRCPHEVIFRPGKIWPTISELIKEKHIDLVVLGTYKRLGAEEAFVGSSAVEIIGKAPCPVLVVGPAVAATQPQDGGLGRILYATDFGTESLAAAPFAISLAQVHHARLILLHSIQDGGDVAAMSDTLRRLVPLGAELGSEPDYVVEYGAASEKILEVAAGRRADLIVLGVNASGRHVRQHLPHSDVMRIVARAACPVLMVSS
jgi:nucleotide-binding universal stress UspA family protein